MDWWTDPIEQQPTWGWGWTKREEEEMLERARGGIGGTGGIRPPLNQSGGHPSRRYAHLDNGPDAGGCNCSLQQQLLQSRGNGRGEEDEDDDDDDEDGR